MIVSNEGRIGRVFVLRLEDGDRLPHSIEAFAAERGVASALCALLGGVGGGELVVGPEDPDAATVTPMVQAVQSVYEAAAVGTLFPDSQGTPRLHMHGAFGRGESPLAGCVRKGVDIWKIAEVVVIELLDTGMARKVDPAFGFELLSPE